ncbi:MAG TPA: SDR family NAD(P)-dependent oxidoreductase [Hyphomicrobiaceae bacterium]|jgi:NAD(P)-dependent dehydrogenase (short-subunit alcohol dehydrogenase family)|nr:SDR family NAD(P)-dependent oxidoreductase [Hyphomicrobiaceae bacterium]
MHGRHALVTGGGSGIGAAVAGLLADAGATVSLAGRRAEPLRKVAAGLQRASTIVADVSLEADADAMVEQARVANGPIDIVVANAGAAESAPAAKLDFGHWQRMLGVNLTGAFLTVKAALPDILRPDARVPRIVFIASTAGLKGYPYAAAYCAAKHGVVGLARALAAELAPRHVTVNAVCPGFTETPLLAASLAKIVAITGRGQEEAAAELTRLNPQRRFVQPVEVAETVLFLCSSSAQAITGQAISVSGGEV